ncbi:hypothetical protein A9Q74_15795 [Colwellia sp. 39_35_sub15_T18]|nr:hypothetical protein A9Q74_15795 [Colwellia sp. 39_35_sub15_T18]
MNKFLKVSFVLVSFLFSGVSMAIPIYLPFGAQTNVDLTTITAGGWTQCYAETMDVTIGNEAENVLDVCQGDYLMMAGRETGADSFLSLAAALFSDTIIDTGNTSNTHLANGSNWWFSDNWSWGFTQANDTVTNSSCDTSASPVSMCLHTVDFTGGYRINDILGLNSSTDYEKVFFVADRIDDPNGIPEPSVLVLLGLALLALTKRKQ